MLLFMVILLEVLVSGNAQQMVKIWEERSSQLLGGSRDHGLTLLNSNCHLIYDISTYLLTLSLPKKHPAVLFSSTRKTLAGSFSICSPAAGASSTCWSSYQLCGHNPISGGWMDGWMDGWVDNNQWLHSIYVL